MTDWGMAGRKWKRGSGEGDNWWEVANEVLVVLMVSQDKGTQGRWDKNREVGGREDGVRSDRIPLTDLISR